MTRSQHQNLSKLALHERIFPKNIKTSFLFKSSACYPSASRVPNTLLLAVSSKASSFSTRKFLRAHKVATIAKCGLWIGLFKLGPAVMVWRLFIIHPHSRCVRDSSGRLDFGNKNGGLYIFMCLKWEKVIINRTKCRCTLSCFFLPAAIRDYMFVVLMV